MIVGWYWNSIMKCILELNLFYESNSNFFLWLCLWFDNHSFISISFFNFHSHFKLNWSSMIFIYCYWNTLLKRKCLFSISNWMLMSNYPSCCIKIHSRNIWKHLIIGLTYCGWCVSKLLVHQLVGLLLINPNVGTT